MIKKQTFISIVSSMLIFIMLASGCASTDKISSEFTCTVTDIDENGNLISSAKSRDFFNWGYNYGDIFNVKIDNLPAIRMPFVDSYADVGTMRICLCDNGNQSNNVKIAISGADFHNWFGANIGNNIQIKMSDKQGLAKNSDRLTAKEQRNEYESDESFANFREIKTRGMRKQAVYRSSNSLNISQNTAKYSYVNTFAQQNGIQTIIDLYDDENELQNLINSDGYDAAYAKSIYMNGNVIALKLGDDFLKQENLDKLALAFRFILWHSGPYLIHCDEGITKTGIFIAILQGLMGASIQEIKDDYMTSYVNSYQMQKGSSKYLQIQKNTIDRILFLLCNPEMIRNLNAIDWENINTSGINISRGVENYLLNYVRLSRAELNRLKGILSTR